MVDVELVGHLPMYDFDFVKASTDALFDAFREALASVLASEEDVAGLENSVLVKGVQLQELSRDAPMEDTVQHHARLLLLGQTCGLPLTSGQNAFMQPILVPTYECNGCKPSEYSSVVVVRDDDIGTKPQDFEGAVAAINSLGSLSGSLLLSHWLTPAVCDKVTMVPTGAHAVSIQEVKEGRARLAALDCVTYALLKTYTPEAVAGTKVIANTTSAPALPFVCDIRFTQPEVKCITKALVLALASEKGQAAASKLFLQTVKETTIEPYVARIVAIRGGVCVPRETATLRTNPVPFTRDDVNQHAQFLQDVLYRLRTLARGIVADPTLARNRDISNGRGFHRWTNLPNGTSARFVMTDTPQTVLDVLECSKVACIGFFGYRPQQHLLLTEDHQVAADCWMLDEKVVQTLDPAHVVAYCNVPTGPGKDYANLVLMRSEAAATHKHSFEANNPPHTKAVIDVAPKYYDYVRITTFEIATHPERHDQSRHTVVPQSTLKVDYLVQGGKQKERVHWV
eukprot:m.337116 g.337116  ORF g.337116 m.337116 type:complete len:512 (-) comp16079_c3_seq5:1277-2812(-)